jgi:transcriptional antiterminator RfaH
MSRGGERWYVVQSQPHAEAKAALHLNRQGFETYLPRYLKRRRHARRLETIPAPLFPRYLFVSIDVATQRWRSILSTIGVFRLVCCGDAPTPVPGQVIQELQDRHDDRGFIQLDRHESFSRGDKIRILNGVFADCLGLYEELSGSERVAILLDLLGRKVRVAVEFDNVAAA